MRILFELSKEHPTLPLSEAKACLSAEKVDFEIVNEGKDFLEVECEDGKIRRVGRRIALSFFIDEVLYSSRPNLKELLSMKVDFNIDGSFRVRCLDRRTEKEGTSSLEVEQKLGGLFASHGRVNLLNPDVEIRVLLTDRIWYIGRMIKRVDRKSFEERKVQNRPFFSPVSMHPRLARAMVNLSLVKKGETLLDPFCGTGGMLLEAGLIGARIIGSDLQQRMIEGCKKNLDVFGVKNYSLHVCDIGEMPSRVEQVDAVVTDFPYGRASTTNRENLNSLYRRSFESICSTLKEGKRAVVTLPDRRAIELGKEYLELVEVHEYRIHKSLTRHIAVYRR